MLYPYTIYRLIHTRPVSSFTFTSQQRSFPLLSELLDHCLNDTPAVAFPLPSIGDCVVQVLVARNAENTTILELSRQGNDIEVKEPNFPLVPGLGGVLLSPAFAVRLRTFFKEASVPFLAHSTSLHMSRFG
jgi:hypothetical protein